jgi:hypothetical protein
LYCFFGQIAVVLIHALTKEDRIAEFDIARALAREARLRSESGGEVP